MRSTGRTHGKDYEDFGKRIAGAREEKGLSQKEASGCLGIPQSTYAGYETGARKIPLSLIKELSRFYEISADTLLGREKQNAGSLITEYLAKEMFNEEETLEILRYARYVRSIRGESD